MTDGAKKLEAHSAIIQGGVLRCWNCSHIKERRMDSASSAPQGVARAGQENKGADEMKLKLEVTATNCDVGGYLCNVRAPDHDKEVTVHGSDLPLTIAEAVETVVVDVIARRGPTR